jgi:hypothetical protein
MPKDLQQKIRTKSFAIPNASKQTLRASPRDMLKLIAKSYNLAIL